MDLDWLLPSPLALAAGAGTVLFYVAFNSMLQILYYHQRRNEVQAYVARVVGRCTAAPNPNSTPQEHAFHVLRAAQMEGAAQGRRVAGGPRDVVAAAVGAGRGPAQAGPPPQALAVRHDQRPHR